MMGASRKKPRMTSRFGLDALAIVAALGVTASAQAESAASTTMSAGSAVLGSVSDSLTTSSGSSSRGAGLAAGEYRVLDVAELADKPGTVRVQLVPAPTAPRAGAQAANHTTALSVDMPRAALGAQGLAKQEAVSILQRPYGFALARTANREAFFLLLDGTWRGEFEAAPVRTKS
jgi:hypothetical protein